ncbi:hypothetical protein LV716_01180 [Flagellimonas sp. HMM57]|uniref:hypothetical protein n=1 Tax=unclassified Flagellimonas TaxID=2644544 RepID=UPI0013D3A3FE|nr:MULTISPECIES: hypothetical protein [unclassified Flagellimonas]UII76426.1 hypothetical protein LV716_01180 [Flagellimonas sp. HMM57]
MIKNKLKFLCTIPFLMAFQCDDDFVFLEYTPYKTKVTAKLNFSLNDTIWIYGKTSSKVFAQSVNDSVFNDTPYEDVFSIYKFIQPTKSSNCIDAVDKFDLISDKGETWFLSSCPNAHISISPELEDNNDFYSYRIGLRTKDIGDYVISWRDARIQNPNRNEFIIEDYLIESLPNEIGFDSCGSISWRSLDESDKEYCFRVE